MDVIKFSQSTGIHYFDYNPQAQRTVLLLHGLGADGSSWAFQFNVLVEAGLRVIAVDIPGFGKSQPLARRWSVKGASTQISHLVSDISLSALTVAGISMGGVVSLQLALDYPGLVERLVLINTFASLRPRRPSEMVYMLSRFAIANFRGVAHQADLVAWRLFPQPEKEELRKEMVARILQANPKMYRQAMISLGSFNATPRLRELKMPTLVISGANDTTVSMVNQKVLASGIAGARHVIIEDAGHAIIVDQPERFNLALISFISEGS